MGVTEDGGERGLRVWKVRGVEKGASELTVY